MNSTILASQHLYFQRQHHSVINDFSVRVTSGEACIITGQNGSGKSTLLKLMAGLYWPDRGNISLHHHMVQVNSTQANYLQYFHYLSHKNGLTSALTIKENLELMQIVYGTPPCHQTTLRIASDLAFQQQLHHTVDTLSFGQRRRLAFARFFIKTKPVWILDEPFTGIDVHHQHYLHQKIQEHLQQNGIALISTHEMLGFGPLRTHRINLSA